MNKCWLKIEFSEDAMLYVAVDGTSGTDAVKHLEQQVEYICSRLHALFSGKAQANITAQDGTEVV